MILTLNTFDYITATPAQFVGFSSFLDNLPRLSKNNTVRLLAEVNTLEQGEILQGFEKVVTPDRYLPPGVMAYKIAYEDFLKDISQSVRYLKMYLFMDEAVPANTVAGILSVSGVPAEPASSEIKYPFTRAREMWRYLEGDDGHYYTALVTKYNQYGNVIYPRLFHELLSMPFPIWLSVQIRALGQNELYYLFRTKQVNLNYDLSKGKNEQVGLLAQTIRDFKDAVYRSENLFVFSIQVVVGAPTVEDLEKNVQIVKVSLPLYTNRYFGCGELVKQVFTENVVDAASDGTMITTTGASILCGSALSYWRRTNVQGVMIGSDTNDSPVVVNFFSPRASSYNTVVLGQTGSGKTFGMLTIMLRHMLMGVRLIILDPQGNVNLDFLGEDIYARTIIGKEDFSINPLDRVYEEQSTQVDFAITILRLLEIHSNQIQERALLDYSLSKLYREKDNPSMSDLYEEISLYLSGKSEDSTVFEVGNQLMLAISAYLSGSRKSVFGEKTTIDFSLSPVVNVFDISNLPEQNIGSNLRKAYLLIILAHINRAIRVRRERGDYAPILFFVDEFGILIRDKEAAAFVSAMYKTARSRLVGMIVADQDLHSLLGPQDETGLHHGVPVLANSANQFIFRQKDSELDDITENFPGIPGEIVRFMPSLPVGNCVASLYDGTTQVIRVIPNSLERIVFSSRLHDRRMAVQIVEQLRRELASKAPKSH